VSLTQLLGFINNDRIPIYIIIGVTLFLFFSFSFYVYEYFFSIIIIIGIMIIYFKFLYTFSKKKKTFFQQPASSHVPTEHYTSPSMSQINVPNGMEDRNRIYQDLPNLPNATPPLPPTTATATNTQSPSYVHNAAPPPLPPKSSRSYLKSLPSKIRRTPSSTGNSVSNDVARLYQQAVLLERRNFYGTPQASDARSEISIGSKTTSRWSEYFATSRIPVVMNTSNSYENSNKPGYKISTNYNGTGYDGRLPSRNNMFNGAGGGGYNNSSRESSFNFNTQQSGMAIDNYNQARSMMNGGEFSPSVDPRWGKYSNHWNSEGYDDDDGTAIGMIMFIMGFLIMPFWWIGAIFPRKPFFPLFFVFSSFKIYLVLYYQIF